MTPERMQRGPLDAPARVERFLVDRGIAGPDIRVVALTGDASDRRYFRVGGPAVTPQVLAVHAASIEFATLPFVNVARLFEQMPVPIPRILGHSDELGILALEDLGDITLQTHLGDATPSEQASAYRQAVALIDTLQRRGRELASPDFLPYTLAFDVEKLIWELQFFTTHFLEGARGAALTTTARRGLEREFASIAAELASEPRVLCHRDYHSRNLMMRNGALVMVDFQDARMGPDTYDLVSLLRDSYVDLPESLVDELVAAFHSMRGGADEGEFRRRFDLMAMQRNLKALGTFGFQASAKRHAAYLQFVPRTLGYVRANLARHVRFARLGDLLAEYLPEIR